MKTFDEIMSTYAESIGNNKEHDLKKLTTIVPPPPKKRNAIPIVSCVAIFLIIVVSATIILFPQKLSISNIEVISLSQGDKPFPPSGAQGPQGTTNNANEISELLENSRFSSVTKGIMLPKLNGILFSAYILRHGFVDLGVAIRSEPLFIFPGITSIEACYIRKEYVVEDLKSYETLANTTQYNGYDINYEIIDKECYITYNNNEVYCCMHIYTEEIYGHIQIEKVLDVIFR